MWRMIALTQHIRINQRRSGVSRASCSAALKVEGFSVYINTCNLLLVPLWEA